MLYKETFPENLEAMEKSGNFVSQQKIDGDHFKVIHKYIKFSNGSNTVIKLINRHENDYTRQFPEIVAGLGLHNKVNCVLNGEIAYWNSEKKVYDFSRFRGRQGLQKERDIMVRRLKFPCKFYVFDLIQYEDTDMVNNPRFPFKRRYELLKSIVRNNNVTELLPLRTDLRAFFKEECKANREGIMVKNINNIYKEGRTDSILKCKNWHFSEIKFTGFENNNAGITLTNEQGDRVLCAGRKAELVRATIIQMGYTTELIRHLGNRTEKGALREGTHKKHIEVEI